MQKMRRNSSKVFAKNHPLFDYINFYTNMHSQIVYFLKIFAESVAPKIETFKVDKNRV